MQISDSFSINRERQTKESHFASPKRDPVKDMQDINRFERVLESNEGKTDLKNKTEGSGEKFTDKVGKEIGADLEKLIASLSQKVSISMEGQSINGLTNDTLNHKEALLKSEQLQELGVFSDRPKSIQSELAKNTLKEPSHLHEMHKDLLDDDINTLSNLDKQSLQVKNDILTNPLKAESAAPSQVSSTSPSVNEVFEVAKSIVDKILVSDPRHSSSEMVTISFNSSSALPQTELTLRRDLDGLLTVMMATNNPKSFNKLVAARDKIVSGLEKLEDSPVRFVLKDPKESLQL